MKVSTTYFGTEDVTEESVIQFPQGLPGFESITRFKLFHEEGKPTVFWLQSLDDEELFFSVLRPELFGIGYQFSLTDEEEKLLEVTDAADIAVLIIAAKRGEQAGSESEPLPNHPDIRGNLNSPLVINTRSRTGIQKPLGRLEQTTILSPAE